MRHDTSSSVPLYYDEPEDRRVRHLSRPATSSWLGVADQKVQGGSGTSIDLWPSVVSIEGSINLHSRPRACRGYQDVHASSSNRALLAFPRMTSDGAPGLVGPQTSLRFPDSRGEADPSPPRSFVDRRLESADFEQKTVASMSCMRYAEESNGDSWPFSLSVRDVAPDSNDPREGCDGLIHVFRVKGDEHVCKANCSGAVAAPETIRGESVPKQSPSHVSHAQSSPRPRTVLEPDTRPREANGRDQHLSAPHASGPRASSEARSGLQCGIAQGEAACPSLINAEYGTFIDGCERASLAPKGQPLSCKDRSTGKNMTSFDSNSAPAQNDSHLEVQVDQPTAANLSAIPGDAIPTKLLSRTNAVRFVDRASQTDCE